MRFPNLNETVTLPDGRVYTTANMLAEFCWGSGAWYADEASIAAFDRITAALKLKGPFALDDRDFDRICAMLRSIQFPPHVAIELTHLRNRFVLSSSDAHKTMSALEFSHATPTNGGPG